MTLFIGTDGRLQWEVLLTGAIALVAAWITVRAINRQVAQADRAENDRRRRRERAARATLPIALDEIMDYAMPCISGLHSLAGYFVAVDCNLTEVRAAARELIIPTIPDGAIAVVKECIEFAEDETAARLVELLRHMQVQHARLHGNFTRLQTGSESPSFTQGDVVDGVIDAAELHARAANLLGFARGADGHPSDVENTMLTTALYNSGLYETFPYDAAIAGWKPRVF